MVSSIFGRLSSVSGRLQNLVLLVLSPKNGRSRRPSKLSASLAGRLRRPCEESCSENLVVVVTTWLESLVFTLEPTKPSKNGRPILFGIENFACKVYWFQLLSQHQHIKVQTRLPYRSTIYGQKRIFLLEPKCETSCTGNSHILLQKIKNDIHHYKRPA